VLGMGLVSDIQGHTTESPEHFSMVTMIIVSKETFSQCNICPQIIFCIMENETQVNPQSNNCTVSILSNLICCITSLKYSSPMEHLKGIL
jgi:hypothetical protein